MKHKNRLRNSKGMSLVEIMVAIGLTSVISLVVMQSLSVSMKSARFVSSRSDYDALEKQINLGLRTPAICNYNFANPAHPMGVLTNVTAATLAAGIDITNRLPITDGPGGLAIIPGAAQNFRFGGLYVWSVILSNPKTLGPGAYLVDLVVNAGPAPLGENGQQASVGSNAIKAGVVVMRFYTDGANNVNGCETGLGTNDLSNARMFDANGAFTVPANVSQVRVEVWGAGGGGGSGFASTAAGVQEAGKNVTFGEGGGSGAYLSYLIPANPNDVLNITVGNGGAGGLGVTPGADGGASQVTCTGSCAAFVARAPGGRGGNPPGSSGVGNGPASDGGAGGGWNAAASPPSIDYTAFTPNPNPALVPAVQNVVALPGQYGSSINPGRGGGPGGTAPRGGVGGMPGVGSTFLDYLPSPPTPGTDGFPGGVPGGGGGPSNHTTKRGGAGGNGRVIVYW